jgi:thiol-disulfide isomerase/thioredoxin
MPFGEVAVAENPSFSWGTVARPMQMVHVEPNKTTQVTLGGQGCPVVGQILIPPPLAARKDWSFRTCMISPKIKLVAPSMPNSIEGASLARQAQWWDEFDHSEAAIALHQMEQTRLRYVGENTFGFEVQPDGTFRVEDVRSGTYRLTFWVAQNAPPGQLRPRLGHADVEFTVPAIAGGRSDEPVEIPAIHIDTLGIVNVGDLAPGFAVRGLDDRPLTLADFRGKYVLLEFWAAWCGPCVAATDRMKAVYRRFGDDSRFVMIGLSLDPKPNDPLHFVTKHGIAWRQGFLGEWNKAPIDKEYDITGIPSVWLIGPDGRVIAKSLEDDAILGAVEKALHTTR